MSLWSTREDAEAALSSELAKESAVIADLFAILDETVTRFEATNAWSSFAIVSAVTIVKGRNLALGSYSLMLDGLAQEGGALLRPLLEVIELLAYIRSDRSRVDEILEGRVPKAGEVAKRINGRFKEVRKLLSENAAHFGLTFESVRHLLDLDTFKLRLVQPHRLPVLRQNMKYLYLFASLLVIEAVSCLQIHTNLAADDLAGNVEELKHRGLALFAPEGS